MASINGQKPLLNLKETPVVSVQPKRPSTVPAHSKNDSLFSPIDLNISQRCHICALTVFGQAFTEVSHAPFGTSKEPICSPSCFQLYIKQSSIKIDPTPVTRKISSPKRPCNIPPPPSKPIPPLNLSKTNK